MTLITETKGERDSNKCRQPDLAVHGSELGTEGTRSTSEAGHFVWRGIETSILKPILRVPSKTCAGLLLKSVGRWSNQLIEKRHLRTSRLHTRYGLKVITSSTSQVTYACFVN